MQVTVHGRTLVAEDTYVFLDPYFYVQAICSGNEMDMRMFPKQSAFIHSFNVCLHFLSSLLQGYLWDWLCHDLATPKRMRRACTGVGLAAHCESPSTSCYFMILILEQVGTSTPWKLAGHPKVGMRKMEHEKHEEHVTCGALKVPVFTCLT